MQGQAFWGHWKADKALHEPHNNAGFNSKGSADMATKIPKKNRRFWPPQCRLSPLAMEPHEYPHEPYIASKFESLGYIFVADRQYLSVWVYLLSNFRSELRKKYHLCSRLRYGSSRSSKVVDFVSVESVHMPSYSNLGPILHRFWDTVT